MFFRSRFCVFTWDDRLVVHTARERTVQITFSGSRVHRQLWELFDRSIFTPLQFSPFSPHKKMLLYQDKITGDEMFSDAFPMYVLSFCSQSDILLMFRQKQSHR